MTAAHLRTKRFPSGRPKDQEVQMPQDTDGSGLVLLLWIAWIYWWIYRSLDFMSVSSQQSRKLRQNSQADASGCGNISAPALLPADLHELESTVSEILQRDGATTLDDFLRRAAAAYEMIVIAFNAGDRDTLCRMLSCDVYDVFCDALTAAEAERGNSDVVFSRIEPPEVVDGSIGDTMMTISLRFVADYYALPHYDLRHPTDNEAIARHTIDVWTFERTTSSRITSWRVVATRTDAP
jgi:predicted lipid-binding transport protein (Tim44 family)